MRSFQGSTVFIDFCAVEGVTLNITVRDIERHAASSDPDETHMTFNVSHPPNTVKILIPNIGKTLPVSSYKSTVKYVLHIMPFIFKKVEWHGFIWLVLL